MKEDVIKIIVCVIMIISGIIGVFIIKPYISNMEIEQTEQMEECEHEWVVTSKFSLLSTTGYRTVSKCIKCGKVIR